VQSQLLLLKGIEQFELLNNKLHGLSPPGGLVSPPSPGGFASLLFDQEVP
jgi:hypothetical protein